MPNNIIDKIQISGQSYNVKDSSAATVVELTQQEYDNLPSSAKTGNTLFVITDAQAGDLTNYYTKTETNTLLGDKADTATTYTKTEVDTLLGGKADAATTYTKNETNTLLGDKADTATTYTKTEVDNAITTAISTKQDTLVSAVNIKTINNQSLLGSGNIDIQGGGGGGTVESAITSGSTNAVESKAIWSATTFNKGVLLTFNGNRQSTNYPEGCGKLVVENIESYDNSSINFRNDEGDVLGFIMIDNPGNISVDTSQFEGATATVDDNKVTIIYPSTGITSVRVDNTSWTYTAVVEGAWVNENTYMKSEIDAIANGLQNSKLDATAYTPTVVDSALNVASTNPVQNQAIYSELRINNGETETTLTFEDRDSTNYPNGCTKLIVEVVGSNNDSNIDFFNGGQPLGTIYINNWGNITVDTTSFNSASYEISGTTVIITYPTVTSVTKIRVGGDGNYVFKAIVASVTHLKDQVAANTTALGGLSLVKLTQAQYDVLATKDSNTLYVIVN